MMGISVKRGKRTVGRNGFGTRPREGDELKMQERLSLSLSPDRPSRPPPMRISTTVIGGEEEETAASSTFGLLVGRFGGNEGISGQNHSLLAARTDGRGTDGQSFGAQVAHATRTGNAVAQFVNV